MGVCGSTPKANKKQEIDSEEEVDPQLMIYDASMLKKKKKNPKKKSKNPEPKVVYKEESEESDEDSSEQETQTRSYKRPSSKNPTKPTHHHQNEEDLRRKATEKMGGFFRGQTDHLNNQFFQKYKEKTGKQGIKIISLDHGPLKKDTSKFNVGNFGFNQMETMDEKMRQKWLKKYEQQRKHAMLAGMHVSHPLIPRLKLKRILRKS
jgi:hypothetical protein